MFSWPGLLCLLCIVCCVSVLSVLLVIQAGSFLGLGREGYGEQEDRGASYAEHMCLVSARAGKRAIGSLLNDYARFTLPWRGRVGSEHIASCRGGVSQIHPHPARVLTTLADLPPPGGGGRMRHSQWERSERDSVIPPAPPPRCNSPARPAAPCRRPCC